MSRFVETYRVFSNTAFATLALIYICEAISNADERISLSRSKDTTIRPATANEKAPSAISDAEIMNALYTRIGPLLDGDDIPGALAAQKELVERLQKLFGTKHWQTQFERVFLTELNRVAQSSPQKQKEYLTGWHQLAAALQKVKNTDFVTAEELLAGALEHFRVTVGTNSFSSSTAYRRRGGMFLAQLSPTEALENYARSLAIDRTLLGKRHPTFWKTLSWMGAAHIIADEFDLAEADFREALLLRRSAYGSAGIEYADLLGQLAHAMSKQKKFLDAEATCLQAIAIAETLQQHDSACMSNLLYVKADTSIGFEEFENAEFELRRSISLFEKWHPSSHLPMSQTLDRHAFVLRKLERVEEATEVEAKAAAIRRDAKVLPKAAHK